ncbi:hypothetical protein VNO78_04263 [Psophocarpus tetragonolobus]|uniref:RING-type domain-containing protein n=1 Tax=Psophocarpus tetragonolobus TaxID=3891 RepID=A0AAN9T3G6_PSOTE
MSEVGAADQREARKRTILGLLREQMEGVDAANPRRRSFKERFGFACCGTKWGFRSLPHTQRDQDQPQVLPSHPPPVSPLHCLAPAMNLAAALAAERQLRGPQDEPGPLRAPGTPWRVSLMSLLEEEEEEKGLGLVGNDSLCCVCMGRNKGAAFIPCGHTFCRVCSRQLWLNRLSCPLCNRSILDILDIF